MDQEFIWHPRRNNPLDWLNRPAKVLVTAQGETVKIGQDIFGDFTVTINNDTVRVFGGDIETCMFLNCVGAKPACLSPKKEGVIGG